MKNLISNFCIASFSGIHARAMEHVLDNVRNNVYFGVFVIISLSVRQPIFDHVRNDNRKHLVSDEELNKCYDKVIV